MRRWEVNTEMKGWRESIALSNIKVPARWRPEHKMLAVMALDFANHVA